MALDFYVDVLSTPDVHCLAVSKKTGQLAGMAPLKDILNPGGRALSCFDSSEINSGILAQYTLIGETGLHIYGALELSFPVLFASLGWSYCGWKYCHC